MQCKKCGSNNIIVQAVSEHQRRGCLSILLYLILICIPIIGWIFLILLIRGKKSKTRSWAVCQDCGNKQVM